ncbi:MAG TPA: BtpA/SgcQ family protein, partial [Verrucomicrobiae bacterium]|nr:BtpA/SgcQ family protein [Verrucomicrobiae bacterium]
APQKKDVLEVKGHTHLPVYLGSGVTAANLKNFFTAADGFIIGSEFKTGGHWVGAVDSKRVSAFMAVYARLTKSSK